MSTNQAYEVDGDAPPADTTHLPPDVVSTKDIDPASAKGKLDGRGEDGVANGGAGHGRDVAVVVENGKAAPDESGEPGEDDDDAAAEALKQKARDKDPFFFCKWITTYPKSFFAGTFVMHIMLFVITIGLIQSGYDVFPIQFGRLPLAIQDDQYYLRGLAWIERNEPSEIWERGAPESEEGIQRERSVFGDFLELYYEDTGSNGNVFTKEQFQKMQEIENEFYDNENYQLDFCKLNYRNPTGPACSKPTSILRYFDCETYVYLDSIFCDRNYDNIAGVLYRASTLNETKERLQYHLGKNYEITETTARSHITRSQLAIGLPLQGFKNSTEEDEEQLQLIEDFMVADYKDRLNELFEDGVNGNDFFYSSISLIGVVIQAQVFQDLALAGGSLIFIVVFVLIQTQSVWVSLFAVFSIISSFVGTNIIYRTVLDYRYLGIFHVLAVFIILGIGADDIFVFFDTWKETSHHKYKSLAHRMSDCYKKASLAMLFTSTTTAVAFIVSATSPFIVISSFGVFAGILVAFNYMSVIIYFPCVVVTHHLYWEKYKCCCCCPRAPVSAENSPSRKDSHRKNPIVRFFRIHYFALVTHKIGRWIILAAFAAIAAVFIYFASTLKVNEEQVKFLKDESNFGKYLAKRTSEFVQGSSDDSVTAVYIIWGLKEQDLSSCHHTDTECTGEVVWNDGFDINTQELQEAIADFCNDLENLDDDTVDRLHIKRSIVTDLPEVNCFVKEMTEFLDDEGDATYIVQPGQVERRKYQANSEFSYPLSDGEVQTIMDGLMNRDIYSEETTLPNHFTVGLSYWLYNGFADGGDQFNQYGPMIGEALTENTRAVRLPSGSTYRYGTELKYLAISINTTLNRNSLGYPKGLPIRDLWEEQTNDWVGRLPGPLQGGFQTTPSENVNLWHWLQIQKVMSTTAVNGLVIGVCLSLPILVIATHNIIVGLMATITICCITVSVIAIIPIAGWKLGLLESLNLVLVVGLAVDYVVHLAEGYSRSSHSGRLGRTRDMLEEVGISVLSGAITTIGASFFLLFAQILFFVQFGAFMFCTIGFSILYALGLFVPAVGLLGPEREVGSLKPLYRWIGRKCGCTKPEEDDNNVG